MKKKQEQKAEDFIIKSQIVYDKAGKIIGKKIVNYNLSLSLENMPDEKTAKKEYARRLEAALRRTTTPKVKLAKYWFPLLILISIIALNETFQHPSSIFFFMVVISSITNIWEKMCGSVPLQSIGAKLFFQKEEAKEVRLWQKFDKANFQAVHSLVASGDPNLGNLEKQLLLITLFAVKNDVYDCLSAAGLLTLLLIESKFSESITLVYKEDNKNNDEHAFIIVNHKTGSIQDITSLNPDCLLIDRWSNVCITVKKILEDQDFFSKHPLLTFHDKSTMPIVKNGQQLSKVYQRCIFILTGLLERKKTACERSMEDADLDYLPRLC